MGPIVDSLWDRLWRAGAREPERGGEQEGDDGGAGGEEGYGLGRVGGGAGGLDVCRHLGWVWRGQGELQGGRAFDGVELAVGAVELFVDLVVAQRAVERPDVIAVAGGNDVGHVKAGL